MAWVITPTLAALPGTYAPFRYTTTSSRAERAAMSDTLDVPPFIPRVKTRTWVIAAPRCAADKESPAPGRGSTFRRLANGEAGGTRSPPGHYSPEHPCTYRATDDRWWRAKS